jgi:SAM-dependent methyltransferase
MPVARCALPPSVKYSLGHAYYRNRFRKLLRDRLGRRQCPWQDIGPVPPPTLITTEALMEQKDLAVRAKARWYFGSGYRDAYEILQMVQRHGVNPVRLRSILEFGCGSARVLRHFRSIGGVALAGTDANPAPIEWNRRFLPGIAFANNALEPPLDYPDESFDLIYALSVFTHIPLPWQQPWLKELKRILRPDGLLLCTVVGSWYCNEQLDGQGRARLARDGAVVLDGKSPRASYSTKVLGSWDVFQSRDQVWAKFGAVFEILDYTERTVGQDMLVLRKSTIDRSARIATEINSGTQRTAARILPNSVLGQFEHRS